MAQDLGNGLLLLLLAQGLLRGSNKAVNIQTIVGEESVGIARLSKSIIHTDANHGRWQLFGQ